MPPFLKKLFSSEDNLLINITSMIDVLFILLIFFMISTQFKKSSIEVNLPSLAGNSETVIADDTIKLSANKNQIEMSGEIISLQTLESRLADIAKQNPDTAIIFSGDKDLSYQQFLDIYSRIEKSGITRIAIEHDPLDN